MVPTTTCNATTLLSYRPTIVDPWAVSDATIPQLCQTPGPEHKP